MREDFVLDTISNTGPPTPFRRNRQFVTANNVVKLLGQIEDGIALLGSVLENAEDSTA